jgi:spore coat polysaccharide biosynthesis protein SpsF
MFPLDGVPVLARILDRIGDSSQVDEVVVATTEVPGDEVVATLARDAGVPAYRGSETDVLGRIHRAATHHDADAVVRICADTPFISDRIVDACVRRLATGGYDYASTKLRRTFPIGYGSEAFTMESFDRLEAAATEPHEREHVTVGYREGRDFSTTNVTSEEFFEDDRYRDRGDLRLTLDRAADYRLIKGIYSGMSASDPSIEDVIDYADVNGLGEMNRDIKQKSMYDTE